MEKEPKKPFGEILLKDHALLTAFVKCFSQNE